MIPRNERALLCSLTARRLSTRRAPSVHASRALLSSPAAWKKLIANAKSEGSVTIYSVQSPTGLQDAANKRAINADAKLLPVFGKPQVTMFELAGIVGKHLG